MICPKCGKEIEHLHAYCHEQNKYEVSYSERHDNLDWSTSEVMEASCTKTEYGCPECGKILFTVEDDDDNRVLDFMRPST